MLVRRRKKLTRLSLKSALRIDMSEETKMNKLQRMVAFAERYKLAWDDPDFDGIYNYITSMRFDRSLRLSAAKKKAEALGCRELYDRAFTEAYNECHIKGEAEAAAKGLDAGYAEDYADGYAADYARSHALGYIEEYVYAIRNMSRLGVDIDVICAVCDITAEEANGIIAKIRAED